MSSFLQMFNIQMILMIYVICGVLCRKSKIITIENQQQFINFVLMILMPCMVFNSFKDVTLRILGEAFDVLIISLVICLIAMILGKILYIKFPDEKRNILRYGTLINNAGFAGLPLAQETFGSEGLILASIFLIPIRIFMWSAGITMLSNERADKKQIFIQLMKNPCIIAVFLGIARGLLQITFPSFIETAIIKMSDCVSPLSMIIIGAIIADVNIRSLFEKGVLLFSTIRLLILPLLVLAGTSLFGLSKTIIGTSMILTAMPAATSTALLAARYNSNVEFASKLVFVTTILSLITAPLLMLLL